MSINENLRAALVEALSGNGPVYAVLDGAHFDDLPRQLLIGGFSSRPLYLDRGDNDPQRILTSPHMVWLDERELGPAGRRPEEVASEILELIGASAGAVFWQSPQGGEALYRHLRGINMVMIPNDSVGQGEVAENEGPVAEEIAQNDHSDQKQPDPTHTMVLFRHADANVAAQLLDSMTPEEAARFMGPATLVFAAPDPEWSTGRPVIFRKAPDIPAYRGPLVLSEATLARIEDTQLKASRGTIAAYLQEVAPEYTERLSRHELHQLITSAEKSGDQIGFQSEHAHGLWALLALITGGEILSNPHVLGHFANDPREPEEVLDELYDQMGDATEDDLESLA